MELAEKYLKSKEISRFSLPSYIANRIQYLVDIQHIVDKHSDELKSDSIMVQRKSRPDLPDSFHLLRYFIIELYAYYRAVSQLFAQTDYKDTLEYPPYWNDGTLKGIRNAFGHSEMEFKKANSQINAFETEYNIYSLIGDYNKFNTKAQRLIMRYNTELVVSRITGEDKKKILRDYPKSKIALSLKIKK
jgi:hypothetical protein